MGEVKEKSARYIYMDVLRIVGCILVVCLHMATLDVEAFSVTGIEWKVMNVMDSLGMTGISFFFMLSGALFLRRDTALSLKYVWKKMGMLLLVYFGALFFYNVIPFIRGWVPWDAYHIKEELFESVLYERGIYHLWFLPTLIVLYALSPILKDAFASKKNCEYFLALFMVFGAAVPLILCFDFRYHTLLQSFQDRFGLFWLTGHIGSFVLGHYLHEFAGKLNRKKAILAVLTAIGSMLFTILCNHVDAVNRDAFSTKVNTPLSLNGLLFVVSIYLLIKTLMADYQSVKGEKILRYFSSLTLGIYLLHPFVMLQLLPKLPLEELFGNYIVLVVVRFLVVIGISGSITAILKKLPLIRRVL